jgi:DNA-binding transcriptional MerR regulator
MDRAYTIGDLERESGVPRTTVHFYLRLGLLPRPQKTAASRSLYTDRHIEILTRIGALKEQGLSLAEIGAQIQASVDEVNEAALDLAAQERVRLHDRILSVAVREFAANGYRNTHVADIVRRSGITATLFYDHFASKRRLLTECVTLLMQWSGAYAGQKAQVSAGPAETVLWNLFGHRRAFELGSAALAVLRLEGDDEDAELQPSMTAALVEEVGRIREALDSGHPEANGPARVAGELVALGLFGSFQPLPLCPLYEEYGPEELLRAQLWLFLAARAARSGEVDIDARLAEYEPLIAWLAAAEPPLPPELGRTVALAE